jgi:transposase
MSRLRIKALHSTRQSVKGPEAVTYFSIVGRLMDGHGPETTLLNLGTGFTLEEKYWPRLIEEIEGIRRPGDGLFEDLDEGREQIRALGESLRPSIDRARLHGTVRRKPGRPRRREAAADAKNVLVRAGDVRVLSAKTAGVEGVVLKAMEDIGFPEILKKSGFGRGACPAVIAQVVARTVFPASESSTLRWLKESSALGTLMNADFGTFNEMTLHRAVDGLGERKDAVWAGLREALSPLRERRAVILFDLTNFYLEGQAAGNPKAMRGRGKEKRSDCRLVTLAVSVDRNGYMVEMRTLPGNVSEPSTFEGMLEALNLREDDLVLMDAGISTKANLELMDRKRVRYVARLRGMKTEYDPSRAFTFRTRAGTVIRAYRTVDRGAGSATIHCHSAEREKRDLDIIAARCGKLEENVRRLGAGLARPGTRKGMDHVHRRIGRILAESNGAGRYFRIGVVPRGDDPGKAAGITCERTEIPGSRADCPGASCLVTNDLSLETREAIQLYVDLVRIEAVFRCLKTELGCRPVFHSSERRTDSHILISCIAYQIVNYIRLQLAAEGIHDSWTTIRGRLEAYKQVEMTSEVFEIPADVEMSVPTEPTEKALTYFRALKMGRGPEIRRYRLVPRRGWDAPIAANW